VGNFGLKRKGEGDLEARGRSPHVCDDAADQGLIVARFVSWVGLLWCGPVVAAISAAILQKHGFGWLSGIAITVACLILNQIGYLIGAYFVTTQVSLSRALEFGDEPFWVCGEGVEHIPTLFFRR
jgi:hypothetical protein